MVINIVDNVDNYVDKMLITFFMVKKWEKTSICEYEWEKERYIEIYQFLLEIKI